MKIVFQCPECLTWTRTEQVDAAAWPCSACGRAVPAAAPSGERQLVACRLCGNNELYVQKAFPHWLGMTILVLAFAASIVTYSLYWINVTWMILIGSAAVDGILYLLTGNVTVCYRCQTHYRGFPPNLGHRPFDLAIGERYRQERLRREQLRES